MLNLVKCQSFLSYPCASGRAQDTLHFIQCQSSRECRREKAHVYMWTACNNESQPSARKTDRRTVHTMFGLVHILPKLNRQRRGTIDPARVPFPVKRAHWPRASLTQLPEMREQLLANIPASVAKKGRSVNIDRALTASHVLL